MYQGVQVAQAELEKDGVTFVVEDSHSKPTDAVSAASKLLNVDKVDVILGTYSPDETIAVAPLALKANKDVFSFSFCSDSFLKLTNVFCGYPNADKQLDTVVPMLQKKGIKTMALIDGIQVDGNDVFAVYKATKEAADRARKGEGPTLIECFTYRIADHTTSDDAKRYRNEDEIRMWEKRDPILRFEKYLVEEGVINPVLIGKVKAEAEQQIERAVKNSESSKPQSPTDMFDYLYENATEDLKEQREQSARENKVISKTTSGENSAKNAGVVGELEEAN
jgi:hypothetical protein